MFEYYKPTKCPIHKTWIKKGICDPCRMVEEAKEKQQRKEMGAPPPVPIKTRKI